MYVMHTVMKVGTGKVYIETVLGDEGASSFAYETDYFGEPQGGCIYESDPIPDPIESHTLAIRRMMARGERSPKG